MEVLFKLGEFFQTFGVASASVVMFILLTRANARADRNQQKYEELVEKILKTELDGKRALVSGHAKLAESIMKLERTVNHARGRTNEP